MARLWDGEPGKQRSELALPVSLVGALKERILLGFADRADAAFAQEEKDSIAVDAGRKVRPSPAFGSERFSMGSVAIVDDVVARRSVILTSFEVTQGERHDGEQEGRFFLYFLRRMCLTAPLDTLPKVSMTHSTRRLGIYGFLIIRESW